MQWLENGSASEGKRILIVENDAALVESLTRALRLPSYALIVSSHDSVKDILETLRDASHDADVVYLDAQLVYPECPDASYYGGLQLVQHLRLTPSLGRLPLLPIVIGTVDTPEWLVRQAVDNVIVFSPGCEAVKLPAFLERLRSALHRHRPFPDEPAMHQAVRPFVLFTDADERARVHAYLNRVGVGKFLKEFAGPVIGDDHPRLQEYRRMMQREVWLKKLCFFRSDLRAEESLTFQESEELIRECRPHRFILVDDDYALGWAFGLRAGLFGDLSDTDDRLLCIGHYDEAVRFFEEAAEHREKVLESWAKAEYEEWEKSRRETEARQRLERAKQVLAQTRAAFGTIEQNLHAAEHRYQQAQQEAQEQLRAFSECAYTLVERLTSPQGAQGVPDLLRTVPNLRDSIQRLSKALNDYELARQSYQDVESRYRKEQEALQRAEMDQKQAEEAFKQAQREHEMAVERLRGIEKQLKESFPYSLVFLDLRLQLPVDERRPVEELTGIRLLGRIKELFPELPVIVMTASEKALSAEKARELGADGYWIKGLSSGHDLMRAVLEGLRKASLKDVWLDICKVKKKREIHCFEWKGGGLVPRSLGKGYIERADLERWLLESFLLLRQGVQARNATIHGLDYPYDHVILNMGLIQEIRYKGVKDEVWKTLAPQLPSEEIRLRARRNDVAHLTQSGRKLCEEREALQFLRYTLTRLLEQRP